MDLIRIADLEVFFHVGVPEDERASAQRLFLSVDMEINAGEAASKDDLNLTIDYSAVSRRMLRFGDGRSWKLIEKLAADLAEMILAEFGPRRVRVEVKKFIIPQARFVSAEVSRSEGGLAPGVMER